MSTIPGYSNLRYVGGAAAKPAEQHDEPAFLAALDRVGQTLGKVVDIFSGSGGPSVRGGGFAGDPHDRRIAADATIDGVPIGQYPGAVAAIHAQGLRSGATDFTYQGRPDPAHVDAVSAAGAVREGAAATRSSIDSPDTFWYAVETRLGLPHNRATHAFLVSWSMAEGTKAKFNPLATTLRQPGSTNFNSVGVQNYPTPEAGVQATADTIKHYPTILAVLRGKQSPYGNGNLNAELNKWVTGKSGDTRPTPYVTNLLRAYQGNPSGKSAADWFSYDGLNLVGDAAHAVAKVTGLDYLSKLFDVHNILRGLQVVAGGVLVLVGVVLLTRQIALAADLPTPKAPAVVPIPVP